MSEPKIVITGTGRAGTTLLLQVLTDLGLDTGVTDDSPYDEVAHAGLERHVLDVTAPKIIKDPFLCTVLRDVMERELVPIEHVIVPMRRLEIAAASRIRASGYGTRPDNWGGLFGTREAERQQESLALLLTSLIETIAEFEIPFTLLWFPRFSTDWRYTHAKLGWLTPHLGADAWHKALAGRVRTDWIHETPLSDAERASITNPS